MSVFNLQRFVNERLSAAALEIWGAVEKSLDGYREEICSSKEENVRLRQLLLDMEIKHRADLLQLTVPENPQIKEEPELRASLWEDELPDQEGDVKSVLFTSPGVNDEGVMDDSSHPSHLYQTAESEGVMDDSSHPSHLYQTAESREDEPRPEPIKTESAAAVYRASEPASSCQAPSGVTPHSEEEESGRLLPELNPVKSKPTQTKEKQNDPGLIDSRETSEMEFTVEVLPQTKTPFQCPECSECYASYHSLQRHVKSHTEALAYHGQAWGNHLDDDGNSTDHMRSHQAERPHQWQGYDDGCKQSRNLAVHLRHRTGEKPYLCQDCGKGFSQKRYMLAHLKTHAKVKPHHCQECGKGFITVRDVRVHMRIHTGEKPYKCRQCGKCFNHVNNMRVHMRTHSGEKPYWCQECGRSFRQKCHLDVHTHRVGTCVTHVFPGPGVDSNPGLPSADRPR